MKRLNSFTLLLGWFTLMLIVFLVTPSTALAHDCLSDPLNGADCMRTPGFRWVLTAGISLAGTLSAIAANLANATRTAAATGQKLPPSEQKVYVLHLSTQTINLKPGEKAPLGVTAYAVTAKGSQSAPEASIQVQGDPRAGLAVAPSTGMGQVNCVVQASPKAVNGTYTLQISATAPQSAGISGTVSVIIEAPFTYELRADPLELSLAPGENGSVTFTVVKVTPDGVVTTDTEAPILLWPPSPKNPFTIDPRRGKGELTCSVTAQENAPIDLYYLDGVANSPDKKIDMKVRVKLRVQGRQVWVVDFRKLRWNSSDSLNLREKLPECNEMLDELDTNGGTLVVQPFGSLKHARGEIRGNNPILDGECTVRRGQKQLSARWNEIEQGYVFKIPPPEGARRPSTEKSSLRIPVRIETQHEDLLINRLLRDAGRIEQSMNLPAWGMAEGFIQRYMDKIAQEPVSVLTERSASFNGWLLNTITFVGSTLEAGKAYQLTLELHSRGFRRFMDALINGIIEGMFAALDLVLDYMRQGKPVIKEAAEKGARETVEGVLEKQIGALNEKATPISDQLRQLKQEADTANLQRYLGGKELAQASGVEKELIQSELNRLEKAISDLLNQVKTLSDELASLSKSLDAIYELRTKLVQSKNLEAFAKSLENFAPSQGANCAELVSLVSDIASRRRQALVNALNLVNQKPELASIAPRIQALINNLDTMITNTKTSIDTAKSSVIDLNIEQELQNQAKKVQENMETARKQADEIAYQAVDWEFYEGWDKVWWFADKLVEWFHWANALFREYIPWFARAEDFLAEAVRVLVEYTLVKPSEWVLDFTQKHQWLTSAISPDLRSQARSRSIGFGLETEFFRFPEQTNTQLNQTINPQSLAGQFDSGSLPKNKNAALQLLRSGAAGGYQKERALQLRRVRSYFSETLSAALEQDHFDEESDADCRTRTRSMSNVLGALLQTMEEYTAAFQASEASGTAGLSAIPERLWYGKEWTMQDLEGALEWTAWAVRWVITFAALLSISTGVGAGAGGVALVVADRVEQIVALLRTAMHALWIMPTVVGFQFDVVFWHTLLYQIIYEKAQVESTSVLTDRYTVS